MDAIHIRGALPVVPITDKYHINELSRIQGRNREHSANLSVYEKEFLVELVKPKLSEVYAKAKTTNLHKKKATA